MQRRDFVRSALFGTAALGSFTLPLAAVGAAADGERPLMSRLARLEPGVGGARWRSLEHCSSDACAMPERVRLRIEALGFPAARRAIAIDAMFATPDGLRPFRMAGFQPDSLSPASKPFAFEVDSASLAGFRCERQGTQPGAIAVASAALLGPARPHLAEGRYLLVVGEQASAFDFDALPIPAATAARIEQSGGPSTAWAWLAFSVQRAIG